jgi:hypothetical protein
MKYVILTLDLGHPMFFMDHPFPTGFSVSSKQQLAVTIEGTEKAMKLCEQLRAASGFNCGFVRIKK